MKSRKLLFKERVKAHPSINNSFLDIFRERGIKVKSLCGRMWAYSSCASCFLLFFVFFSPLAGNYKNTASGCCVGGLVLAESKDYQKCNLSFLICRQDD